MEKDFRIIIADTNWWVSLVIKNYNNKFASILLSPKLKFISSFELTQKIKATLSKERLQKLLNPVLIKHFWYQFEALVTTIHVVSRISLCRDPGDNFLLALDRDSNADFLITGDKHLLILEKFENTIICTLTDFMNKYLNK